MGKRKGQDPAEKKTETPEPETFSSRIQAEYLFLFFCYCLSTSERQVFLALTENYRKALGFGREGREEKKGVREPFFKGLLTNA